MWLLLPICTFKQTNTYPRCMQTHTQRTLTQLVTRTAMDKALPATAPTYRTHTNTRVDSQVPSSSWAGRDRRSLVQAHAHSTLQVHKHTHLHGYPKYHHGLFAHPAPLSQSQALLPAPQVPDSPAGPAWCSLQTHGTHMLIPQAPPLILQAPHTCRSPRIPAWTPHPPDSPVWI